jgi:hypothetical protein
VFSVTRLLALASVSALGVSVAACGNSGSGSATSTTVRSGTSIPGAGKSGTWTVAAKFAAPATVECVLRGVAAS